MTRPAYVRADALELLRRGLSINAVAERVGVNRSTVMRWQKKAASDAPPPPVEQTQPDAPAAPRLSATAGAKAEDLTRYGVDHALSMAERAITDGNTSAAAKFIRDALGGANNLARIERTQRDGEDRLFTREQLEAGRKAMAARVAALAADLDRTGGPVCRRCGCELRMALAQGE